MVKSVMVKLRHCIVFPLLKLKPRPCWKAPLWLPGYGRPAWSPSDCLSLVHAVHSQQKAWLWRAATWLGTIRQTLETHPLIKINHIGRKSNSKANWVARSCTKNQLPSEWLQVLDVVAPLL
ncbi:unnamed protein product [Linum trigynum]|uniref:RNase H type-1 domain-containing protein n=1 Tax=Linum trigynum TaxID=586398 RepID=A0AAV2EZ22_9ROSI